MTGQELVKMTSNMSERIHENASKLLQKLGMLVPDHPDIAPILRQALNYTAPLEVSLEETAGKEPPRPPLQPQKSLLRSYKRPESGGQRAGTGRPHQEKPVDLALVVESSQQALTVPELAKLLNCSPRNLYQQIKSGRLSAIQIGTMIRLSPASTAAWLRSQITSPTR
jgi:excisionase family DNA binding protein